MIDFDRLWVCGGCGSTKVSGCTTFPRCHKGHGQMLCVDPGTAEEEVLATRQEERPRGVVLRIYVGNHGYSPTNVKYHLRQMDGYEAEVVDRRRSGRPGRPDGVWGRKTPALLRRPSSLPRSPEQPPSRYLRRKVMAQLLSDLGVQEKVRDPLAVRWVETCATCNGSEQHQCCPGCKIRAEGRELVDRVFGFRTVRGETRPQPRCKRCR